MFVEFAPRDNANANELTVNVKCAHVFMATCRYVPLKFIASFICVPVGHGVENLNANNEIGIGCEV